MRIEKIQNFKFTTPKSYWQDRKKEEQKQYVFTPEVNITVNFEVQPTVNLELSFKDILAVFKNIIKSFRHR